METIFDELVENVLEAVRKFLVVFHVILGVAGVTLTLMTYHKSGSLQFGPSDMQTGHALLAGFVGIYLVVMIFLKACRLPEILEGSLLGLPLGAVLSLLILQRMNVPLHISLDAGTVVVATVLLGLAAWMPYPTKT